MSNISDPTIVLCEAARSCVSALLPGRLAARVAVYLDDGSSAIEARVSPTPPPSLPSADRRPKPTLTATERAILRAVLESEIESPTGSEIAEAAALPNEANFRRALSSLRRRGLLGGGLGDQGYPLSDLGLSAIDD